MEQSQKRIILLEKILTDNNKVEVGMVAELFGGCIRLMSEKTKTFQDIKSKVSEEEWARFLHGLSNSFLTSLYVTASNSKEQLKERMDECDDANKDVTVGKMVSVKKDKHEMDA